MSAVPITLAAWFRKPTQAVAAYGLLGLYNSAAGGNRHFFLLRLQDSTFADGASIQAAHANAVGVSQGTSVIAGDSAAYDGTWIHCGAVFSADNNRVAYFNGTAGSAQTTARAGTTVDLTTIGRQSGTSPANYAEGDIGECAAWAAALTADEMASLAAGVSPLFIRPASLAGYWPLWGRYSTEPDLVGGYGMTVTGATYADHPRVINPSRRKLFLPAASTPPPPSDDYHVTRYTQADLHRVVGSGVY